MKTGRWNLCKYGQQEHNLLFKKTQKVGEKEKIYKIRNLPDLNFPFVVFNTFFSPRNQWFASTLLTSLTPQSWRIHDNEKKPHQYPPPLMTSDST
jgi:hypothetical protein